jgi:hypothetical protein
LTQGQLRLRFIHIVTSWRATSPGDGGDYDLEGGDGTSDKTAEALSTDALLACSLMKLDGEPAWVGTMNEPKCDQREQRTWRGDGSVR